MLAFVACVPSVYSQLTAPGRNWASATQYVNTTEQDSIFTFFASTGALRCKHSTGGVADYSWYRYNSKLPVSDRFELFFSESGVVSSMQTGLTEGGYRVEVVSAGIIETYTVWLFTDNIQINRVDAVNRCDFLELVAITTPSSYVIEYDRFVYHDLSKTMHSANYGYGKTYFSDIVWQASDSRISFSQSSSLRQTIEGPAPLYNSTYDVAITNVFGRSLSAQTGEITAIAASAVQKVQVETDGVWADYASGTDYEALLGLRLESESVNADSLYWFVLNQSVVDYDQQYVVIWRDSSLFSARVEAYPTKDLMRPGHFKIRHLAYNTSSGCKDSVDLDIKVDSSKIAAESIPNVFSPNNDGVNDMFVFITPEESVKSIQSFSIKIFSRSGRQVYEHSGDPREWKGWNGKVKGSGADASEGVYFFIIEAKGWDNREFDYGPYKGFLHLYRGK
ncbi:MAG: gliding motility-associated C-terminal domain-containing protein [Bacteroidales bacterium]|nr:gliding motility-associated C-terminal domain-containing protein [Bacteroidales bacterium]